MKRNEQFFLRRIGDSSFLIPSDDLAPEEKKIILLNETSVFLWNEMGKGCGTEDLVKALTDRYDVPADDVNRQISEFISFLSENGCLEEERK